MTEKTMPPDARVNPPDQDEPARNGLNESGPDRKKKRIWTVLFVLINIAVIAATAINEFAGNGGHPPMPKLSGRSLVYLGCTALCLAVLLCAETLKYRLMMKSLKEQPLKGPHAFRVAFETAALGKYYDCITPSGAGGQPFQIFWLRRNGFSDGAASAMTITGYVTMQSGFILLALATFISVRTVELEAMRYTAYAGLLLFSLIPCLLVLFSVMPGTVKKLVSAVIRLCGRLRLVKDPDRTVERMIDMLDSYHHSLRVIAKNRAVMGLLLLLSLVYRVALCAMPYFVLKMFGAPVKFAAIFASIIYIYATITLVPTPGNAGAAEGAFYLVFSAMESDGVFWAMLIWRLFSHYSFIIIGGIIYGVNALRGKRTGGGRKS